MFVGQNAAHLVVQQAVFVAVRRLVSIHLLSGHSSEFLGQLPPPGRHLHRRRQQDEIQDQSGDQTLAVHLQQGLNGGERPKWLFCCLSPVRNV